VEIDEESAQAEEMGEGGGGGRRGSRARRGFPAPTFKMSQSMLAPCKPRIVRQVAITRRLEWPRWKFPGRQHKRFGDLGALLTASSD
jgi:hypothetical protein